MNTKINITIIFFSLSVILLVSGLVFKETLISKRPNEITNISNELKKKLPSEPIPTVANTDNTDYTGGIMELKIETIKQGEGADIKTGQTAEVHYTGTLLNGTKFDSSRDRNQTFEFTLGENRVIQGWEKGVLGMRKGEVRKLTIPYTLAYGEQGSGPIPPKATLVFEVELVNIK